MTEDSSWRAVLTGDIIRSSKMQPNQRVALYNTFASLSALLMRSYPGNVTYAISNFRGDGWQLVCQQPEESLEVGIFIRSYLRFSFKEEKLDTRFAIGIGRIHFIPRENVSAGDGEAFTLSGTMLDSLGTERMAVVFPKSDGLLQPAVDGMTALLDFIVSRWSPGQAQAVFLALHGYKQDEIAAQWMPAPITQASVSAILKAAGWSRVKKSLASFEKIVEHAARQEEGR
jgi:hypothetical protein